MPSQCPDRLSEPLSVQAWSAWPLQVPLAKPYRSAKGTLSALPMLHTQVRTDDGEVGHSVVFVPSFALLRGVVALASGLKTSLENAKRSPIEHAQLVRKRLGAWGAEGVGACVASALELALFDARSRRLRLSMARMLGAKPGPVRTYGGIGLGSAAECVQEAERLVSEGHRALKLKIGHAQVEQDLEVIGAVQRAVGDGIALMVDYNQSLSVDEAIRRGRALEESNLTWIEEPVAASDLEGHAAVAAALATSLQSGENWWHVRQVRRAIELRASDGVMLDPAKLGIGGWLDAADAASRAGLAVSSHLSPHLCSQLMCATPSRGWLEWTDWWQPFMGSMPVREGQVLPADEPVSWDETALLRHRMSGDS
jgi:mandelate racemase